MHFGQLPQGLPCGFAMLPECQGLFEVLTAGLGIVDLQGRIPGHQPGPHTGGILPDRLFKVLSRVFVEFLLLKLRWCGGSKNRMKLVWSTEIQRLAVSTEIPQSAARLEKLSNWAARPAQRARNRKKLK